MNKTSPHSNRPLIKIIPPRKPTNPKSKTALFQCWIDPKILRRTRQQRDLDRLQWRELIEGMFRRYLQES